MNTEMQKFEKALNDIANVFTDVRGTYNRLGFVQEQMLGAIPQQLQWGIEYNEGNPNRLPKLRADAEQALAEDKGDEMSARNIAAAYAKYEALTDQLILTNAALEVAKKVFHKRTGKEWAYRRFDKVNQDVVDVSDIRERARRGLGVDRNVAAGHNSAKAG